MKIVKAVTLQNDRKNISTEQRLGGKRQGKVIEIESDAEKEEEEGNDSDVRPSQSNYGGSIVDDEPLDRRPRKMSHRYVD